MSARAASDATRVVAEGVYSATIRVDRPEMRARLAAERQASVCVRADSDAGVEHVRFVLGLDDDHSEFHALRGRSVLGETIR